MVFDDLASARLPMGVTPPGTKGRVLVAALKCFARDGFAGTSIRSIASEVGINSATLYSHFASKEKILFTLVEIGAHELFDRISAAHASSPDPAAQLRRMLAASAMAHAEFPMLAIVTHREVRSLDVEAARSANLQNADAAKLLRGVLVEGTKSGIFQIADLETTARVLEGIPQQLSYWSDIERLSPPAVADALGELVDRVVGVSVVSNSNVESTGGTR